MVVGLNTFYTRAVPTGTAVTGFTQAFTTTAVAELIVVKMITENTSTVGTAPTATGLTFTSRATISGTAVWSALWTAPAAASTAYTINYGATSAAGARSVVIERWTGVTLATTPAVVSLSGTGAPSATLTTTAANSAVSWSNGDWSAVGGARSYRTTSAVPVEELSDQTGAGSTYIPDYAYQLAPTVGVQTLGLTAPVGQTWAIIGIELPATAGIAARPRHLSRWR